MSASLWVCLIAFAISVIAGAQHVRDYLRRDIASTQTPTKYPNGVPLPPLNAPIQVPFEIAPTYNQSAGSGTRKDILWQRDNTTGITFRPLAFAFNGIEAASVHRRGSTLVYIVGGKEVSRKQFYRFMDAWLQKSVGLWESPK